MPAIFRKTEGDEIRFWMMTYALGGEVIHLQLVSGDTAFGTKHLLNTNMESAAERKNRRDCMATDAREAAINMCEFLNFNARALPTNTVIEYASDAELQIVMAEVARVFGSVTAWPAAPRLHSEIINLPTSCVNYTGAVNKTEARVELGAFLKSHNGMHKTIVIKHLTGL